MNSRISDTIVEIESRFSQLRNELSAKSQEIETLNAKLNQQAEELMQVKLEKGKLEIQLKELENESKEMRQKYQDLLDTQSVAVGADSSNEVAIDLLVREIDQCIIQLKGNL